MYSRDLEDAESGGVSMAELLECRGREARKLVLGTYGIVPRAAL